jgi:type IV secretion system protein VirB1
MIAAALLACAPHIAPATLEAVIAVESRGAPLAIFDNTTRRAWRPHDQAEAITLARQLVAAGHRVDLGLMQVDSVNLPALGLSVTQAFDPCTNVRAGATILTADYAAARQQWGDGQIALQHALSAYNAGNFYRGFRNGYVARYYGRATVPAVDLNLRFSALDRRPAGVAGRFARNRTPGRLGQDRSRPQWLAKEIASLTAPTTLYRRFQRILGGL